MNAARFVRLVLERHGREGADFMAAWTSALQSLPRGTTPDMRAERRAWVAALKWARPAYQAAYEARRSAEADADADADERVAVAV